MKNSLRSLAFFGVLVSSACLNVLPVAAQSAPESSCVAQAKASGNAIAQINALGRARNLARQAAEAANGGLEVYRADASMHGTISDAPCVDNGNGTWTFTVKGGEPGFVTPTKETVVTVDGNNWTVKVDYNGPIRS